MAHGIGKTQHGLQTKIHLVCDWHGRPWSIVVTPGNIPDIAVAQQCLAALPASHHLAADKGYDANILRNWLHERGTIAVIPPMRHRKVQFPYDKPIYKQRSVIERTFCRLKDWRRIATRYDRNVQNYLAAITIATIVSYWLR